MPKNISSLTINASIQRVWDILTLPEYIKFWQYGSDLKTTWEIGTEIRFRTEWEDKVFEQWGKVLAFQFPNFIQYSLFAPRPGLEDKPGNYFVMNYFLKEIDDQTHLEIIQEDHRANAVQEEPQGILNPILKTLKDLAESDK